MEAHPDRGGHSFGIVHFRRDTVESLFRPGIPPLQGGSGSADEDEGQYQPQGRTGDVDESFHIRKDSLFREISIRRFCIQERNQ